MIFWTADGKAVDRSWTPRKRSGARTSLHRSLARLRATGIVVGAVAFATAALLLWTRPGFGFGMAVGVLVGLAYAMAGSR